MQPKVTSAITRWQEPCQFAIKTQKVERGEVLQDSEDVIEGKAFIKPMELIEVQRLPDAERSKPWYRVLTLSEQPLLDYNDQIVKDGKRYTVQAVADYSANGYRRYNAVLSSTNGN